MFESPIPPIKRGDPIRASWLEKVRRAAVEALDLKVEPPLELVRTAGGLMLRLVWRPRFWVEVLSGTQPYAWREKVAAPAGGWSNGTRSGTALVDPAYEQNGNKAVPSGLVLLARRAWGTGAVTFQLAPCTANTPSPGITPGTKPSGSPPSALPPPPRMVPPPESFSGFPGGRPFSGMAIPP